MRWSWVVIGALTLSACDRSMQKTPNTVSDSAVAVRMDSTCTFSPSMHLSGEGLGTLRVGALLTTVSSTCRILSDSTELGEEALPVRIARFQVSPSDTVLGTVRGDSIWRLAIDSRGPRTQDSLGVGSRLADLLRHPKAFGLQGEGQLFVLVERHCGLSFRIDVTLGDEQYREEWREAQLRELNQQALVDRVLVFGCRRAPRPSP